MTLETFLKEKRVLTKFRTNFRLNKITGKKTKAEAEEFIIECSTQPNGIITAFHWQASPEGYAYWDKLDQEWVAICNKK